MTDVAELGAQLMSATWDEPASSSVSLNNSVDQDIRARVHELLIMMYPPAPGLEQRRDRRYPYPQLVRLTPVADEGLTRTGPTIVVVGKTLSETGFGFYHPQPLAERRMIASFHTGDNRWVGLLIDLRWCRFTGHGWYESGGRFLQSAPSGRPGDQKPEES